MNQENTNEPLSKTAVMRSCWECRFQMSGNADFICHIFCSKTERDFTFGGENTEACEFFEED